MRNLTQTDLALLAFAREVQEKAYAPYSGFHVGAAIYANDEIFQGVNVENSSYGATMCAEHAALAAAVAAGCMDVTAIAIVGDSEQPTLPCGCCRQALAEFNSDLRVIMGGNTDEVLVMTLSELLPEPFVGGFAEEGAKA